MYILLADASPQYHFFRVLKFLFAHNVLQHLCGPPCYLLLLRSCLPSLRLCACATTSSGACCLIISSSMSRSVASLSSEPVFHSGTVPNFAHMLNGLIYIAAGASCSIAQQQDRSLWNIQSGMPSKLCSSPRSPPVIPLLSFFSFLQPCFFLAVLNPVS